MVGLSSGIILNIVDKINFLDNVITLCIYLFDEISLDVRSLHTVNIRFMSELQLH
jgi:hypothetical protein